MPPKKLNRKTNTFFKPNVLKKPQMYFLFFDAFQVTNKIDINNIYQVALGLYPDETIESWYIDQPYEEIIRDAPARFQLSEEEWQQKRKWTIEQVLHQILDVVKRYEPNFIQTSDRTNRRYEVRQLVSLKKPEVAGLYRYMCYTHKVWNPFCCYNLSFFDLMHLAYPDEVYSNDVMELTQTLELPYIKTGQGAEQVVKNLMTIYKHLDKVLDIPRTEQMCKAMHK